MSLLRDIEEAVAAAVKPRASCVVSIFLGFVRIRILMDGQEAVSEVTGDDLAGKMELSSTGYGTWRGVRLNAEGRAYFKGLADGMQAKLAMDLKARTN